MSRSVRSFAFPRPPVPLAHAVRSPVPRVLLGGQALRLEQRKWHPDKWGAHVLGRFPAAAQAPLAAAVHALSQTLNRLAADRPP